MCLGKGFKHIFTSLRHLKTLLLLPWLQQPTQHRLRAAASRHGVTAPWLQQPMQCGAQACFHVRLLLHTAASTTPKYGLLPAFSKSSPG